MTETSLAVVPTATRTPVVKPLKPVSFPTITRIVHANASIVITSEVHDMQVRRVIEDALRRIEAIATTFQYKDEISK